jgi:ribosomal protein S18 acetylase RimI-like enzyme
MTRPVEQRCRRSVGGRVQVTSVRRYQPELDSEACRELYFRTRQTTFYWVPKRLFRRADFFADTEGEELFVAERGGRLVGFAGVYLPDFLHHLYVAAAERRSGVGSRLLDTVLQQFTCRLRLKVLVRNGPALAFYQARGFRFGERGRDVHGDWVMLSVPPKQPLSLA